MSAQPRPRSLRDAVDDLHDTVRQRIPLPVPEPRGYRSELARFPALTIACRFCRDVQTGEGLAQRFVRIPPEHVDAPGKAVRCLCGASVPFGDLRECPGGCGRWMAADESGAWAARFEAEPC